MYEGLRLTELHEEWANARERAARYENLDRKSSQAGAEVEAEMYDAEIRARVACMVVQGPDGRAFMGAPVAKGALLYGVSDAERSYPAKRRGKSPVLESFLRRRLGDRKYVGADETFSLDHWTNHAQHAIPVEGCHLCREGRR